MTWTEAGEYLITQKETTLPVSFDSPALAIKAVEFTQLKASWNWAGYFIQTITLPVIGQIRIEEKINLSTKEATLIVPKLYESDYQLVFYKADWIPQFKLIIYESDMPLNTAVDSVVFPNTKASSATSTAIAVTATSAVLLAANVNRKSYLIENNSNQDLYIDFAATVSVPAHAIKIPKVTGGGGISSYEEDNYTGVISGIAPAAGAGAWNIREFI
jgi:hypothetical protein